MSPADWNPESYARFGGLRLQPARDLIARIGGLPGGAVVDLGCGAGAVGPVLRARFGDRPLISCDISPAMLAKARETGAYDKLSEVDLGAWQPAVPPALIFSNAALHWLDNHETLLPRLAGMLAPGGTLAVQVPNQNRAPSHRLWHDLADRHFPGRVDRTGAPGVLTPVDYHRILSPLGRFALWETEYFQVLPAADDGHPVRAFTSATFARPVLSALRPTDRVELGKLYDRAMETAYPRAADGTVLFPFRRLFFTLDI